MSPARLALGFTASRDLSTPCHPAAKYACQTAVERLAESCECQGRIIPIAAGIRALQDKRVSDSLLDLHSYVALDPFSLLPRGRMGRGQTGRLIFRTTSEAQTDKRQSGAGHASILRPEPVADRLEFGKPRFLTSMKSVMVYGVVCRCEPPSSYTPNDLLTTPWCLPSGRRQTRPSSG